MSLPEGTFIRSNCCECGSGSQAVVIEALSQFPGYPPMNWFIEYVDTEDGHTGPTIVDDTPYWPNPPTRYLKWVERWTWHFEGITGFEDGVEYWVQFTYEISEKFGDIKHVKIEDSCIGTRTEMTLNEDGTTTNYTNPAYNATDDDPCWYLATEFPGGSTLDTFEADHLVESYTDGASVWGTKDVTLSVPWTRTDAEAQAAALTALHDFDNLVILPSLTFVDDMTCDGGTAETVWLGLDPEPVGSPHRHITGIFLWYRRGCPDGIMIQERTITTSPITENHPILSKKTWIGAYWTTPVEVWENVLQPTGKNFTTTTEIVRDVNERAAFFSFRPDMIPTYAELTNAMRGKWRSENLVEVIIPQDPEWDTFDVSTCGRNETGPDTWAFDIPITHGVAGPFLGDPPCP